MMREKAQAEPARDMTPRAAPSSVQTNAFAWNDHAPGDHVNGFETRRAIAPGGAGRPRNFAAVPAFLSGPPTRGRASPIVLQKKLAIGRTDDPLEHEADRVADQVMRMPDPQLSVAKAPPQISRKCAACESEDEKLQKKSAGPAPASVAPAIVHEVLSEPGQPLDLATRTSMERRFGRDFSGVRVHTGGVAEQSAREVNANAYTAGHNIVFGAGKFAPRMDEGRRLIAHELAHVVQQSASGNINSDKSCKKSGISALSTSKTDDAGVLRRDDKVIPTSPGPALPEKIIPGSTNLSRQVQAYRVDHPNLPEGTNLVGVEYGTPGGENSQIRVFENRPGVAHSEEVMDQFFRDLRRTSRQEINVKRIYSERQFCGPSEHDCEGLLLKSERYKSAEKTFGYDYQDLTRRGAGGGPYRAGQTRGQVELSHERLNETKNLEWDFQKRPTQPYHERLEGPKGGGPPVPAKPKLSGELAPTVKPSGVDIPVGGVEAPIVGAAEKGVTFGAVASVGRAALSHIAQMAIFIAIDLFLHWVLAKLFELQVKNDINNILEPQLVKKLEDIKSKLDALQGSKRLYIRVTYEFDYIRSTDMLISAPPFYQPGSVRLVNVHPGNEELDFEPANSEATEKGPPLQELVKNRFSYSVLLDDPIKRAQAERTRAEQPAADEKARKEKLANAMRPQPPKPSPPLLAPPGPPSPAVRAPQGDFLNAPGAGVTRLDGVTMENAELLWTRFEQRRDELVNEAQRLNSGHSSEEMNAYDQKVKSYIKDLDTFINLFKEKGSKEWRGVKEMIRLRNWADNEDKAKLLR